MSVVDSAKTVRKRAVAKAEEDYRAAIASARTARETAVAQAAAKESEAIARAKTALAVPRRLLEEAVDSVERKLRQADLEKVYDEHSRLLDGAARTRKQATDLARVDERKALDMAKANLKAALLQAAREELETKTAVSGTRAEPQPPPSLIEEGILVSSAVVRDTVAPGSPLKADSNGRIKIGVSGNVTARQLFELESALRGWKGIKLIMTIGSGSDTVYYVKSQGASLLSAQFRALPCVADVVTADGEISVSLKTDARACSA